MKNDIKIIKFISDKIKKRYVLIGVGYKRIIKLETMNNANRSHDFFKSSNLLMLNKRMVIGRMTLIISLINDSFCTRRLVNSLRWIVPESTIIGVKTSLILGFMCIPKNFWKFTT